MPNGELPKKWQQSAKVVKAVQIAFDMDSKLQYSIRRSALTVSLSADDYIQLGKRYNIPAKNQLDIKKYVIEELTKFAAGNEYFDK